MIHIFLLNYLNRDKLGKIYTIEYGENKRCFNLTILEDEDKEYDDFFAFLVELKLGVDRRRIKFPGDKVNTYGTVVIKETCTCA